MTDVIQELLKEITERENSFQSKLIKLGHAEIAADYSDITTIRRTIEILSHTTRSISNAASQTGPRPTGNNIDRNTQDDFVLSEAVRQLIHVFGEKPFSVNDFVPLLEQKYNRTDIVDRKSSISATLGNLANNGEIERIEVGKGGAPSIYVKRNRQPVLLEEAKNGSEM